ncbi:polyprenyl synthetase family protein [Shimazuella sp. AN120528]|uniref:polyprenyl synthetase family protein n=1 Tax=Shimazuella soli TaxID=1892854 RepID=UPI001F1091A2|nr:polyprenyl synthetase family protein [Shimazuella soli]MCH5586455.1 polyprenyl synthetase family protein [Shimazuella soli]
MRLASIYRHIKKDLEVVEDLLTQSMDTNLLELRESSTHLLRAGGKRMRPVFVLLSGRFGVTSNKQQVIDVAVALELIHMATLVHDDVIDNASLRRGQETVKARWDNRVAMYTGDYIISRALSIISNITIPQFHQELSKSISLMCRGEIDQIQDLYNPNLILKQYLSRIKRKTALLMSISCYLGALVSHATPRIARHLKRYGYYVGMAFQLTDDVLDFTGDEKTLGKPAGSDLKQGNVTLPVIYALKNLPSEERKVIEDFLATKGREPFNVDVLDLVIKAGGNEFTLDLSKQYLNKALRELEKLPSVHEQNLLKMLAEFIVGRNY